MLLLLCTETCFFGGYFENGDSRRAGAVMQGWKVLRSIEEEKNKMAKLALRCKFYLNHYVLIYIYVSGWCDCKVGVGLLESV